MQLMSLPNLFSIKICLTFMIQLSIRIYPEVEIFRHVHYNEQITSYCSGKRGITIFTYSNKNPNYARNEKLEKEIIQIDSLKKKKVSTCSCDCANNPPSLLRRIIHSFKGVILDPVFIKDNWEYMNILLPNQNSTDLLLLQLQDQYDFEIQNISQYDRDYYKDLKIKFKDLFTILTEKQSETLIDAWKQGYYSIPRTATTKELASVKGISRYALEKKLRTAENKIMDNIIPFLLLYGNLNEFFDK